MKQELIDQAIGFLAQYRDTLVASYSSIGEDGKFHLMSMEECRDDLDVVAVKDIASLNGLIAKMTAGYVPFFTHARKLRPQWARFTILVGGRCLNARYRVQCCPPREMVLGKVFPRLYAELYTLAHPCRRLRCCLVVGHGPSEVEPPRTMRGQDTVRLEADWL
ncbi:hypothetical protein ACFX5Q_32530 [Mesorhizobium sp. IMUNJ 23033]|uniref:hypothetical protein n=1 Tax=Mesorhizobium sp. IMUNJ 23033 TaxID=3378039 RepID=UPI00384BF517